MEMRIKCPRNSFRSGFSFNVDLEDSRPEKLRIFTAGRRWETISLVDVTIMMIDRVDVRAIDKSSQRNPNLPLSCTIDVITSRAVTGDRISLLILGEMPERSAQRGSFQRERDDATISNAFIADQT